MEEMNFEQALARLEEIVAKLEGGNLPLEQTLGMFEEGIRLFRCCEKHLKAAEGRVLKLAEDLNSGWELTPLDE